MKTNWYSMVSQIQAHRNDPLPLQYILGGTFFCGEWFIVTPGVLIPRMETETLVEYVIKKSKTTRRGTRESGSGCPDPKSKNIKLLDLGTGCGNIAIILAKRLDCYVYAIDISDEAINVAKRNARMHGVEDKIKFCKIDWCSDLEVSEFQNSDTSRKKGILKGKRNFPPSDNVASLVWKGGDRSELNERRHAGENVVFPHENLDMEPVDIIVSNPPYIAEEEWDFLPMEVRDYEPRIALWGGKGGLEHYKKIISSAKKMLAQGGRIAFEVGYNQAETVVELLEGFTEIEIIQDCYGNQRVVSGVWIN